jgi:amino acid transporter
MSQPAKTPEILPPQLGVYDVAAITAGIIIGSGIYRLPPIIASNVAGGWQMLCVWILGGAVALIGALCFAELAAAYPHQGGTYVYLNKSYGRAVGFLYVWAEFWIVRPGNIAAMAFIFAEYARQIVPGLNSGVKELTALDVGVASAVVSALALLNLLGVRTGKGVQMALTIAKIIGLLGIFAVGMFAPMVDAPPTSAVPSNNWLLAMVLVLFAYGGWNETPAVAAEVRHPKRNMLRGLLLGTAIVVLTYLLFNLALLRTLGFVGVAKGEAVAAQVMTAGLGTIGGRIISVLVCISCLGAINGMLFTGSRLYYALGREQPAFAWLGHWNQRLGTPVRALLLQSVVAVVLLWVFGLYHNAFEQLVLFTVPLFWTFLMLVSVAVVHLRFTDVTTPRPFRLPLFPLEPAIFCCASLLMVYKGIEYLSFQKRDFAFYFSASSMVIVLLAGVIVYAFTRLGAKRAKV